MLLPSRVAGRTLGLRGPDLARGPEVTRPWPKPYSRQIAEGDIRELLSSRDVFGFPE